MEDITLDDGNTIVESNFEVEDFDLIWVSEYTNRAGGGYNRIYINEDKDSLVYSNKDGYVGLFDSVSECFGYLYDNEYANEVLDIDEEEFLKVDFDDVLVIEIDDENKITIGLNTDLYNDYFYLDVETKEVYLDETYYKDDVKMYKYKNIELEFKTLYVGSADGNDSYWVKKEKIPNDCENVIEYIKENDIDFEWTDFGFFSRSYLDDYFLIYGGKLINTLDEAEINEWFVDFCKSEDLVD